MFVNTQHYVGFSLSAFVDGICISKLNFVCNKSKRKTLDILHSHDLFGKILSKIWKDNTKTSNAPAGPSFLAKASVTLVR